MGFAQLEFKTENHKPQPMVNDRQPIPMSILQLAFFILLLLFLMPSLVAQSQNLYQINEVKEAPVFPGCEYLKPNRKKEMGHCISRQLSIRLAKKLAHFNESMIQSQTARAEAQIQFVISKEGIIINPMETEDSHPLLAEASIQALNEISYEIPPIRPAKNKKGEPVNLLLQLPVVYTANLSDITKREAVYPVDEIVLFTMLDGSIRYEIRLFKEKYVKVYEVLDGKTTYLGRFMSLPEAERSEPYKELIAKERKSDRIFVADGYLGDEFFEVYIYHLFDRKKSIYIEVFKNENSESTLTATFQRESDFNNSIYAPLIYR